MKMTEKEEDETRFERVTYRTAAGCSTPELFVLLLDDDKCGSQPLKGSGGHRMPQDRISPDLADPDAEFRHGLG